MDKFCRIEFPLFQHTYIEHRQQSNNMHMSSYCSVNSTLFMKKLILNLVGMLVMQYKIFPCVLQCFYI